MNQRVRYTIAGLGYQGDTPYDTYETVEKAASDLAYRAMVDIALLIYSRTETRYEKKIGKLVVGVKFVCSPWKPVSSGDWA